MRKIYSVGTNERDFDELWQQHKRLKIMEMNETWPDIYGDKYINQFHPEPIFTVMGI